MTPNERPTPLTDSASFGTDDESLNRLYGIRELPKYVVPADFARTLERSLAERTEERDKLLEKQSWLIAHPTAIEAAHQVVEWTKCEQERDTALAKLAKCRGALELFDLGVGLGVTEEMYDKRKSALEETK